MRISITARAKPRKIKGIFAQSNYKEYTNLNSSCKRTKTALVVSCTAFSVATAIQVSY